MLLENFPVAFKQEGKPSDRETLISRLIDRPIRPLFPDNFNYEVRCSECDLMISKTSRISAV